MWSKFMKMFKAYEQCMLTKRRFYFSPMQSIRNCLSKVDNSNIKTKTESEFMEMFKANNYRFYNL